MKLFLDSILFLYQLNINATLGINFFLTNSPTDVAKVQSSNFIGHDR